MSNKPKPIYITGARDIQINPLPIPAGFIGPHLSKCLSLLGGYRVVEGSVDIRSQSKLLSDIPFACKTVVHLAALTDVNESIKYPDNYYITNVVGTLNVLKIMREKNLKRIIYTSTIGIKDGVYSSPYVNSKSIAEMIIKEYSDLYGIEAIILRLSNVYGPDNTKGVIYNFLKKIEAGQRPIVHGDGRQTRDFIHINDVKRAIVKAIDFEFPYYSPKCLFFEIGTGKKTSILELLDLLGIDDYYTQTDTNVGIKESVADWRYAKKWLGFRTKISLEEGLERLKC